MPEDEPQPYQRRQSDIDNASRIAVIQAMVPYQLRIESIERSLSKLDRVVFGDEILPGLVAQMKSISAKLDVILKESEERKIILHSLKRTAEVTRWIVVFLGSLAGLVIALNAIGVIHL